MYNKTQFLNAQDLTMCLGEDIAEEYNLKEGENDSEILQLVWKHYKKDDWANHDFYKIRGIVYDLQNDLNEFKHEVSRDTFKKVCNILR